MEAHTAPKMEAQSYRRVDHRGRDSKRKSSKDIGTADIVSQLNTVSLVPKPKSGSRLIKAAQNDGHITRDPLQHGRKRNKEYAVNLCFWEGTINYPAMVSFTAGTFGNRGSVSSSTCRFKTSNSHSSISYP